MLGAAAALLAAPRAQAKSVEDGGFTCSATATKDGASIVIEHGEGRLAHEAPPGGWDTKGLACTAWQGKALRLVVPGQGAAAYEIFAALDPDGNVTLVWEGTTGLAGDYGERWGWFLDWEPTKPGGQDAIPILYALHEQVRLCGHGMVPVYVKAYDPASLSFRPISFDRLRRAGAGWGSGAAPSEAKAGSKPISIIASPASVKDPPAPPMLDGFLSFQSSSSTLGHEWDPNLKSAPLALADGKPSSGWVEGIGGHGWGEFVTATVTERDLPVTRLVLHATRSTDKKEIAKWNRLKRFELTTSTGKRFVVKVPTDPAKHPGRPIVITFPKPLHTECLSMIVRDVYASKKSKGEHTYVGEIAAYTSLDTGGGMGTLLAWFDDPEKAREASGILAHTNSAALDAIVGQWEEMGPAAHEGVIGSIHEGWLPGLLPLVEKAAATATEDLSRELFVLLSDSLVPVTAGPGSGALVHEMERWVEEPGAPGCDIAATVLGRKGNPAGVELMIEALCNLLEEEGPSRPFAQEDLHDWIREGLGAGGLAQLEVVETYLHAVVPSDEMSIRISLILLRLLDYAGGEPVRDLAATWASRLWDGAPTLFCHHHLMPVLEKLTKLGDPRGIEIAARTFDDPDAVHGLRIEALATMEQARGDLVKPAIEVGIRGLGDPCPGVRARAASLVRRVGPEDAGEKIVEIALTDPWPEVRIEAIRTAAQLDHVPIEAIWDFLRDKDSSARKQAIRLVVQKGIATEEVGILLANTTLSKSMRKDVRAAAAHAIGTLCIVEMAKPLGNVVFYGTTPDATEGEIQAAAAAAEAIGMIGDPGPIDLLIDATRPGLRLEIRAAAIASLGLIGGPKVEKVLSKLAESLDPAIRAAALESLETLGEGAVPACQAAR